MSVPRTPDPGGPERVFHKLQCPRMTPAVRRQRAGSWGVWGNHTFPHGARGHEREIVIPPGKKWGHNIMVLAKEASVSHRVPHFGSHVPHEALARVSHFHGTASCPLLLALQVSDSRSPAQIAFPDPTPVHLYPVCSLRGTSPSPFFSNVGVGSSMNVHLPESVLWAFMCPKT